MEKLIKKVQIENMLSTRSWNPVASQFKIITEDGSYFQSYSTMIAFLSNEGQIYLDEKSWDYSRTTLKYLGQFLGGAGVNDIRERIKSGRYILTDLN